MTADEADHIYDNTTASIPSDYVAYYKLNGNALDETGDYDGTATNVVYGYDGTASNITYSSALGFTPDLIWVKNRTGTAADNIFVDSVRGDGAYLYSPSNVSNDYNANHLQIKDNGFRIPTGNPNVNNVDYLYEPLNIIYKN